MLRRLATAALALSLALISTNAHARGFASPPPSAPRPFLISDTRIEVEPPFTPSIAPAMRARLKAVLSVRRAKNIAAFRRYAQRGVYPHNFHVVGPANVWIDEEGHMCAAATMIFKSGAKRLVSATARDNNFVKLGEVTSGPLLDWMLTSGLTQVEAATIQEPFMGPVEMDPRARRVKPIAKSPRQLEDERLSARYQEVLGILAAGEDASLEEAIDRLAARPDLIATLVR